MFGQDDQQDNNQQSVNSGAHHPSVVPPANDDVLSGVAEVAGDNSLPASQPVVTPDNSDSSQPEPTNEPADESPEETNSSKDSDEPKGELAEIKAQALKKLAPLVEKLDQDPEEKFRTIMMMIQSTDNKDLIKEAYEAAQEISDEAEKAKALLAVINEVDYFTKNKD